jgi:hypothetical protein
MTSTPFRPEGARLDVRRRRPGRIPAIATDGYHLDVIPPAGFPRGVRARFKIAFAEHQKLIVALLLEKGEP